MRMHKAWAGHPSGEMDNQLGLPCSRSIAQAFARSKDKARALQDRFCSTSYPIHSTRNSPQHKETQSQRHRLCPFLGSLLEKLGSGNATGN